jgi:prepilin-type N-terminal cleavage/methylation domain-containing protein
MKARTPIRPIRPIRSAERGLSLVELIITVTILSILAGAAFPIARFQTKRMNERILRYELWTMRDAIDRYHDAAEKNAFRTKVDSQNYPETLEKMVEGEEVQTKKVKFFASHSGGPDDRQGGVGIALDAGRSQVGFLRRAERLRRVLQVNRHGAGRNQVFGLVGIH